MERRENWKISTAATGTGASAPVEGRIVRVPFEQFVVSIALSEKNEFQGIVEISVREDFRSLRQRLRDLNVHDVEQYYKESD